jgi:hypothetical protein
MQSQLKHGWEARRTPTDTEQGFIDCCCRKAQT